MERSTLWIFTFWVAAFVVRGSPEFKPCKLLANRVCLLRVVCRQGVWYTTRKSWYLAIRVDTKLFSIVFIIVSSSCEYSFYLFLPFSDVLCTWANKTISEKWVSFSFPSECSVIVMKVFLFFGTKLNFPLAPDQGWAFLQERDGNQFSLGVGFYSNNFFFSGMRKSTLWFFSFWKAAIRESL